jgi:hypothetical protein
MNLDLTDEQTEALIRELSHIVESDPYPFSPRIRVLRDILAQLRPEPSTGTFTTNQTLRAAWLHPRTVTARLARFGQELETCHWELGMNS